MRVTRRVQLVFVRIGLSDGRSSLVDDLSLTVIGEVTSFLFFLVDCGHEGFIIALGKRVNVAPLNVHSRLQFVRSTVSRCPIRQNHNFSLSGEALTGHTR